MNAKISILALALLGGAAMAAPELVWSAANGNGKTLRPYGSWYTYTSGGGTSVDTATTETSRVIELTVTKKTVETSAGVGFAWKKENGEIDLSAYEGMCLTYSAKAPFRVDFKQSTITDDNFHGYVVPKQSAIDTLFIPFADLAQEDWGDDWVKKALNLKKQTGVQFSYKRALMAESGVTTNTIEIASIALGSSCGTHAPNLKAGVTSPDEATLNEGDTLKVAFNQIFEDADGDDLNIVLSISGDDLVDLKGAKSYTLKDVAWLKSVKNPGKDASATATFTAKDPEGKSVKYVLVVALVDLENPPVAVNDEYTVEEEGTLTVTGLLKGVMGNDYDDDGDAFTMELLTETTHGTLTVDQKTGGFTYVPDADFYGEDTWTYRLTDAKDSVGNVGTVTITVTNVNDPLKLEIVSEEFFKDTISLEEDFEEMYELDIPEDALLFTDADGVGTLKFGIKTSGIVDASYNSAIAGFYVLELTSVPNKNGLDSIYFYATEGGDTAGIYIYVKVAPVADPPLAVADTYKMFEDSTVTIAARKGVLANDVNPDDPSVELVAVLDEDVAHGKLKLEKDGSFTYTPTKGFVGTDAFTYYVYTDDEDKITSASVKVTLDVQDRNDAPVVVVDPATLDTTIAEDSKGVTFVKNTVLSWFKDAEGDPLTITAASDDGKTTSEVTSAGALIVHLAKDSVGDAYVTVTAKDTVGGAASLKIHITISPVNDKPVIAKQDSFYVKETSGWSVSIPLADYVFDVDGDSLTYTPNVTNALTARIVVKLENDTLKVSGKDNVTFDAGSLVAFGVKVSDAATYVTLNIHIFVGMEKPAEGLRAIAAAPKSGWQGAILANRGVAAMMDMQGRVMWKAKLPVSEADVRNAAAQVQGRKVLRVNNQTWTIK